MQAHYMGCYFLSDHTEYVENNNVYNKAQKIVTFKCSFIFKAFVSRAYAAKHLFILIMSKLYTYFM